MQLPGADDFLARMVNDCCIDDALARGLSFTIGEYIHEAQRVPGFFGIFTKKPNATHNPLDKRTGGKFMRHANITRAEILVSNVQTWVDRTLLAERAADDAEPHDCLRVAPRSLRALALKRPGLAVPERLPASHRDRDAADREAEAAQSQRRRTGDGPPPTILARFYQMQWSPGGDVQHFIIWTKLTGDSSNRWHQALVTRKLPANFRRGYTHDARFSDGIRGDALTGAAYSEGCWVVIIADEQVEATSSGADAPTPAPAAARAPVVAAALPVVAARSRASGASSSSQGQSKGRPASKHNSAGGGSSKRLVPALENLNPSRAARSRLS